MTPLTLQQLQEDVAEMCERRGFDKAGPQTLALGVCEEAGELARSILLTNSPDYTVSEHNKPFVEQDNNVAREVGDLITYCLVLCNKLGIEPKFSWMK